MTTDQIVLLLEFAASYAECPCCEKSDVCVEGCTFEQDAPANHAEMQSARNAIKGVK